MNNTEKKKAARRCAVLFQDRADYYMRLRAGEMSPEDARKAAGLNVASLERTILQEFGIHG